MSLNDAIVSAGDPPSGKPARDQEAWAPWVTEVVETWWGSRISRKLKNALVQTTCARAEEGIRRSWDQLGGRSLLASRVEGSTALRGALMDHLHDLLDERFDHLSPKQQEELLKKMLRNPREERRAWAFRKLERFSTTGSD